MQSSGKIEALLASLKLVDLIRASLTSTVPDFKYPFKIPEE